MHHRQAQKWDNQEQQATAEQQAAYEQQMQAQAVAEAPAQPDYMAELEQLNQLKNQGIITAEEFEAKKKQLLGI